MSGSRDLERKVRALAEPAVELEGFELVAVLLRTLNGRRTLQVFIDRPGGIAVRHCTRVSHLLSALLDVEDPIAGRYQLEVSSPGMNRPLQRPSDFDRFAGYRARVRLDPRPGRRNYTGRLLGLQGDLVGIETADGAHQLPLCDIEQAGLRLDLEEFKALSEHGPAGAAADFWGSENSGAEEMRKENSDDQ